jgi:hypothetical protein
MTATMPTYWTAGGGRLQLAERLGGGGEGTVHALAGDSGTAVKVYASGRRTPEAQRKITAMRRTPPYSCVDPAKGHVSLAWVRDLVMETAPNGQFVGFTMPRFDRRRFFEAHLVYDPQDRINRFSGGMTWEHLVLAAANLTHVVTQVHHAGHCVGDLREANLLVALDARVTLIDCDSFEIHDSRAGQHFYTRVGAGEFLPPELLGVHFASREVPRYHADLFALGVLIFKFLMEGSHPFQGRGGPLDGANSIEKKIALGIFTYEAADQRVQPPLHAPDYRVVPPEIRTLFHRCFVAGLRDPERRPAAGDWTMALLAARKALRSCTHNSNHRFGGHLQECPWCEQQRKTGIDPFPPPDPAGQQVAGPRVTHSLTARQEEFREFVRAAIHQGQLTPEKATQVEQRRIKLALNPQQGRQIVDEELRRASVPRSSSSQPPQPQVPVASPPVSGTPSGGAWTQARPQRPPSRILRGKAKRLVVLFLVLGVALWLARSAVEAITAGNTPTRTETVQSLTAAHDSLVSKGQKFQQDVGACASAPRGQQLTCVQTADRDLAAAFETFASDVAALEFPASSRAEAREVERLGRQFAGAMRQLVAAPTPEEYTRLAAGTDQIGSSFDQRYQALVNELAA